VLGEGGRARRHGFKGVAGRSGVSLTGTAPLGSVGRRRTDTVTGNHVLRDTSFAKMSAEAWDAIQRVHLHGGFFVTRAAWLRPRAGATAAWSWRPPPGRLYGNLGQANYGAVKLGLPELVNTLGIERRRNGIDVNAVAPLAATRMTGDIAPPELLAALPPAHVSPVVGYLLSDECTDTGTVVAGGGQVHWVQLFQSKGVTFSDVPTMAEVADRWAEVTAMSTAVPGTNPVG